MSQQENAAEETLQSEIDQALDPEKSGEKESASNKSEETDLEEDSEVEPEVKEEEEIVEISKSDLELLKSIRDPKTKAATIRALAEAEKLIDAKRDEVSESGKPITKAAVRKTSKEIAEEVLGEEINLLPDKFFELFETLLQEKLAPLVTNQYEAEKVRMAGEVDTVFQKLSNELSGYAALENEMNALVTEYPPAQGLTLEKYMRRLYTLAAAENPTKVGKKTVSEKSDSASEESDRKIRIRIGRNSTEPTVKGQAPEKEGRVRKEMTLDDSIRAAIQSQTKK